MSKTYKFTAGDDLKIHKMSEEEITQLVKKEADAMLSKMPKEFQVSEVNSIQLQSSLRQAGDIGGWAEWTRACCDRRSVIQDFTDPENPALRVDNPGIEAAIFQNHFDSNLSLRKVTEPESLKKMKDKNK